MWGLAQALVAYFLALALGAGVGIGWGGDAAWLSPLLGISSGCLLGNLAGKADSA